MQVGSHNLQGISVARRDDYLHVIVSRCRQLGRQLRGHPRQEAALCVGVIGENDRNALSRGRQHIVVPTLARQPQVGATAPKHTAARASLDANALDRSLLAHRTGHLGCPIRKMALCNAQAHVRKPKVFLGLVNGLLQLLTAHSAVHCRVSQHLPPFIAHCGTQHTRTNLVTNLNNRQH